MRQKSDSNTTEQQKKCDINMTKCDNNRHKCDRNATIIDSNKTEIRLKYDIYMRHKTNRDATKIRHKCEIKATDMR